MNNYFSRNVITPRVLDVFYSAYEFIINEKIQSYDVLSYSDTGFYLYIRLGLNEISFRLLDNILILNIKSVHKSENLLDNDIIKVKNCLLDLAQKRTDNILKQINYSPTIDINEIEL